MCGAFIDPCLDLTLVSGDPTEAQSIVNPSENKAHQMVWDAISTNGPCCFKHPSAGVLCLRGRPCTWCPTYLQGITQPSCVVGEAVSLGRGEDLVCLKMGWVGLCICTIMQPLNCAPPCMGCITVLLRRRIRKRFRLQLTGGFEGFHACDHPFAVCCCYHYAMWKHSTFSEVLQNERAASAAANESAALLDKK